LVYLIDASIYIFRGWQKNPSTLTNTYNEAANAVLGFTETLVSIIERDRPQWLASAFDSRNRNATRYQLHPQYKANRSPSPESLVMQFQRCQQVCKALGVAALSNTDIEADDIIGQMAQLAREQQQPVTIVSADKDLAQFIAPGDCYWNFVPNTRSTYRQLHQRFGVRPEQIADLLALCGDKTDNIPGVPGVGQATAARVLTKWGNLDGVFANLAGVAAMRFRGAAQGAILLGEHGATVRFARQLTGLITSTDLPTHLTALNYQPPSGEKIIHDLIQAGFTDEESTALTHRVVKPSSC